MPDLYFFSLTVINCFVLGFMCMIVNFSEALFPETEKDFSADLHPDRRDLGP